MFNVRPDAFRPWLYVRPPADADPPGFRVAADGSVRNAQPDVTGFMLSSYGSGATAIPGSGLGVANRPAGGGGNPFGFLDRQAPGAGHVVPFGSELHSLYTTPPTFPEIAEPQPLQPGHHGYAGGLDLGLDTPVPGFRVEPANSAPGFRIGANGPARDTPSDAFGLASFGYNPHGDSPPTSSTAAGGAIRRAGDGPYPAIDLDYPSYLVTPPPDHVQEALDQLARIYTGVGGDRFFARQRSHAGPIVTVGDGFRGGLSPASGGAMDPRHIVPVQTPPGRPPPGSGHNRPPAPIKGPASPSSPQPPTSQRGPSTQPPPDTAGPAAAVDAATQERATNYNTYREQLQALDPNNPLLKLEPVPGVVPDRATVDRYGEEVRGIVRKRIDGTIEDLSAQSTYDQRSIVRTIGSNVDLRAEFERLKVGGRRIDGGGRGQYSRGDGELYELPGGLRVGFRMANDMRTGQKRSVPTLEITHAGKRVRFHYNNQR